MKIPNPFELVVDAEGKLSLERLAAATGHALFAVSFVKLQILGSNDFMEGLWWTYGALAVGHTTVRGAMTAVQDFKTRKLEAQAAQPPKAPDAP